MLCSPCTTNFALLLKFLDDFDPILQLDLIRWALTSSTNVGSHVACMTQLWLKFIKACGSAASAFTHRSKETRFPLLTSLLGLPLLQLSLQLISSDQKLTNAHETFYFFFFLARVGDLKVGYLPACSSGGFDSRVSIFPTFFFFFFSCQGIYSVGFHILINQSAVFTCSRTGCIFPFSTSWNF